MKGKKQTSENSRSSDGKLFIDEWNGHGEIFSLSLAMEIAEPF